MKTLFIQLPGDVTDTALKKVNELQITMSGPYASSAYQGNGFTIWLNSGVTGRKARIVDGDAHFTDSTGAANYGKECDIVSGQRIYVSGGTAKIYLDIKDCLNMLTTSEYATRRNMTISEDLCYSNPTYLELACLRVDGKFFLDNFNRMTSIIADRLQTSYPSSISATEIDNKNLLVGVNFYSGNVSIYGSIIDFKRTNYTLISITGETLTGTVESLIELWYSSGKHSGDPQLRLSKSACTFNGNTCPATIKAVFSENGVVLYNGAGTQIGSYDGDTWNYN